MKHWKLFLFIGGVTGLAAFLSIGLWLAFRDPVIVLEGEVEATEVDVAAKIPGRIERVAVRRGQVVHKGDELFVISSPELEAKLDQAEAARSVARAIYRKTETGPREQEIRATREQWKRAEAAADLAGITAERMARLQASGVVPRQRYDEAETQARASLAAAEAARAILHLAIEGAREEDRSAAGAMEAQAAGAVAEVEAFMAETLIRAPIDGEVSSLLIDAGELAPAGFPVITLVDRSDTWVVFQIREDLLATVGIGTELLGKVPALGGREIRMRVDYIAVMGAFATWRATSASSGFDLKTFEVHARPVDPIEELRPGMSVIVSRRGR